MAKAKQSRQSTAIPDKLTPIPSVDEIYQQRTAIDALAQEIANDEKLFNEASAEKKKQLHSLKAALAQSIRQANTALQQLAVPVTVEVVPTPEPFIESITITDVEPTPVPAPAVPPITVPTPVVPTPEPVIPQPAPVIPNTVAVTPNYKPFYIIIGVLILLLVLVIQCNRKPAPNPGPDPSPNPKPSPIVITKADEIIKAVNAESLTYNEKIVEATRRLTMECGMEREAAYQYASEKITKGTNDDLSDSVSALPPSNDAATLEFVTLTPPNFPSLPPTSFDRLEKKKNLTQWMHLTRPFSY